MQKVRTWIIAGVSAVACLFAPQAAIAAPALDGAAMGWPWALPFAGILLSIAVGPLLMPKLRHSHHGKIALAWSAATLIPLALVGDLSASVAAFVHAILGDYLSFIILLFTLYVVAGGILVTGNLRGTPAVNTAMLAIGTALASLTGTTGAAMILIRPLLRANATRLHNVHVVVFFIFLVANIGGALTPLGDPPLFVGFLHGVDFFWTTRNLAVPTASIAGVLLVLFFAIDWYWYRRDRRIELLGERDRPLAISIKGWINVPLIGGVIAAILVSAMWRPGIVFNVDGTELALQNVVRDAVLLVLAAMSLLFTPNEHREVNGFSWGPILEVAKLFAGIFICVIPVLAMLRAGPHGSLGWLFERVTLANGQPHDVAYFWLAGLLSALLDNAPTYLVFFELAGGNAKALMTEMGSTLAAISAGAVYLGALTYIGNAPNFMVYAIAAERGIKMPSFFGYLAWSMVILLPIFAIVTLVMR